MTKRKVRPVQNTRDQPIIIEDEIGEPYVEEEPEITTKPSPPPLEEVPSIKMSAAAAPFEPSRKRVRGDDDGLGLDLFSIFEKSPMPDYSETLPVPRGLTTEILLETPTTSPNKLHGILSSIRTSRNATPAAEEKDEDFLSITTTAAEIDPTLRPPWCPDGTPPALSEEILLFEKYMNPSASERKMRAGVIQRIKDALEDVNVDIVPFGSYSSDIYLPYSDIDIVMFERRNSHLNMRQYERCFRESGNFANFLAIPSARIPILKMVDMLTGIRIDISFNQEGGVENTQRVLDTMKRVPHLRPLIMVVKYFLEQRALNDPSQGGLGSYSVVLMVFSFLQHYHRNFRIEKPQLGQLLTHFFSFLRPKI